MKLNRPKAVIVNIKGDYPETRKVYPHLTSDGLTLLVMEPATENKAGWTIDITSAITHDIRGRAMIDVIRGDRYPIHYNTVDADKTIRKSIFPFLSLDHIKEYADLEVFKKAVTGVKEQLAKLTPLMWIIIICVVISLFIGLINLYMVNGVANTVSKIPIPTPAPPSV